VPISEAYLLQGGAPDQKLGALKRVFSYRARHAQSKLFKVPGRLVIHVQFSGPSTWGKQVWSLLGHRQPLELAQDEDSLKVKLSAGKPCKHAYALKITGLASH
jgi:hypothetical protein